MADFKYEIVEHIGTLSESAKGWTEHEKMGKGVTLSEDEMLKLKELL